ncbi:aryl-alcohol dehydrogenase-like predicted oxidoreductase [Dongia mobilis]|uniref:Protein tas n=1 Tax=Dongia mobilis TaxID=578943 RepID=A0A4V3DF74_9PROT|nr:NADP(H)-dependent aldo-keto reductase [Dongia mobilis]TDQ84311.1 aryl-alcohol dehydrogenase-like predicted oxidoreductase [Dongia mobilis]
MEFRRLGRTDINVSLICLGTMTFGEQNSEAEGHQQMDMALERGVNFWDTAEMYAVPPRAETYGATERIIGSWFRRNPGKRDKVVLASKIAGPDERLTYVRGGKLDFSRASIRAALDESLRRLGTDYIDLYQLHWTERSTNSFGRLGYEHKTEETFTPFAEVLAVFADEIKAGRIRAIGLSNESAWGTTRWMAESERLGLPRMASIQNAYSLLNRSFEVGLAEVAHRENCGLLAYSPLGMGALTGKYLDGSASPADRLNRYPHFKRYRGPHADPSTAKYVALARSHGLDPAQMALAFVNSRPFVTSNIIGATNLAQLGRNIDSADIRLSAEVVNGIEAIHKEHTYPCP